MEKVFYIIICLIFFSSCNKEKYFDGPDFYQDDFESYSKLEDMLLSPSGEELHWSFIQLTYANNEIRIDTNKSKSGKNSLRFFAQKAQNNNASKASICKQHMAFWEGETVRITASYFIESEHSLEWLFLMDLEEKTEIGAGPGMRLALVKNQLRIEYKFNEKDILQIAGNEIDFPRNQWVELIWEVKLSRKNKGTVKLWQDGMLIIDSKDKNTLPKDILYFQQGTKGMYSNVEIGITANSHDNDLVLWVDDFKIEKLN